MGMFSAEMVKQGITDSQIHQYDKLFPNQISFTFIFEKKIKALFTVLFMQGYMLSQRFSH